MIELSPVFVLMRNIVFIYGLARLSSLPNGAAFFESFEKKPPTIKPPTIIKAIKIKTVSVIALFAGSAESISEVRFLIILLGINPSFE